MEVWLITTLLAVGLLQFLDTGLYTYLAYNLSVGGSYLGAASAVWSLIYIVSNRFFSRFADDGRNKMLLLISSAALSLMYVLCNDVNEVSGLVMYSLHAFAIAVVNLSLSVTILETYDYTNWNGVNAFSRVITNLVRGSSFLVVALSFASVPTFLILATALTSISMILIPGIGLNIERTLFKINKDLRYVGKYIKASTALLYIHKPREALEYFERVWSSSNELKPWRVITSTVLYAMFGDLVLVVLPLILKGYVGLSSLWLSWGIALLSASFIVVPVITRFAPSSESINPRLIGSFISLRGLTLALLLPYVSSEFSLSIYLLLVVVTTSISDSYLYNKFVEVSSGYSISKYYIAREVGSIIGSIAGGLVTVALAISSAALMIF